MIDLSGIAEWSAALAAVATACGLIVKGVTRDVARDVADLKHFVKNQAARIDSVEHLRSADVERIVKLEAAVQSFDKAIERVERGQEKLTDTINDRFDTLAASIREIRIVKLKD